MRTSISSASTPFAPCRWTPCRRPTRAIPARRWPWRRSPTVSGSASSASIRRPDLAQPRSLRAVVGHASMLLYSLLHLTGVKAVNPQYETLGEPSVTLDDIRRFPPARQPLPRPSGVPLDHRRRDHHRPARPGGRHQRRHGHRRPLAGAPLQPAGLRAVRLSTSTPWAATAA